MPELPSPPEVNLASLREVFNRHRAESGMTFDDLAEATGISRRSLLNISGGHSCGDLKTWLILSRVWNVSLDELFNGAFK